MSTVPLRRLLDKSQIGALLSAFANLATRSGTLGLADTQGKWLAAHPAPPPRGDNLLVCRACAEGRVASDAQAVAIPLVVEGEVYGALYHTIALEPVVPALRQVVNALLVSAVTQKSLARETLERYREINLLYEVHETIGSSLELDVVVRKVLEESIRIIKADGGSVLLADDLTDRLIAHDSVGLDVAQAEQTLLNQALSDKVLSTGKPSMLNDLEHDSRPEAIKDAPLVSLLSAPLKSHQRVLGVITLGRTREDAMFTAGDLKLLMALASQAGVAIANAREVEARERRLKQRIAELHIEIDEAKKQREVTAITDSEFFDRLQENARQMRAEFDV